METVKESSSCWYGYHTLVACVYACVCVWVWVWVSLWIYICTWKTTINFDENGDVQMDAPEDSNSPVEVEMEWKKKVECRKIHAGNFSKITSINIWVCVYEKK